MEKFVHIRAHNQETGQVLTKGGTTVAYEHQQNGAFRVGIAKCHHTDNYNKHLGRAKAAGKLRSARFSYVLPPEVQDVDGMIRYIVAHRREFATH